MQLTSIFSRILIATDGVDYDSKAVRIGLELAQQHGAILIALSVVDTRVLADFSDESPGFIQKMEEELFEGCSKALDKIEEQGHTLRINVEKVIRHGKPHLEIIQEATKRKVSLIILGKKRHASSARHLGGIVERVLEDADCSVLVVR